MDGCAVGRVTRQPSQDALRTSPCTVKPPNFVKLFNFFVFVQYETPYTFLSFDISIRSLSKKSYNL